MAKTMLVNRVVIVDKEKDTVLFDSAVSGVDATEISTKVLLNSPEKYKGKSLCIRQTNICSYTI